MAPTAIRVLKKEDYEGEYIKKHDTSSIKTFCIVGERCDPDTVHWLNNLLPNVILNDTWW
jgi:propionyl-CoA synthetase